MIEAAAAPHREQVGGLWDEIGRLQYEFLVRHGLQPRHRLLDIGCGCLRAGVHLIGYLAPGNYVGVDADQGLLDAGFEIELAALGLQDRMPRRNLVCMADFEFERLGRQVDFALAHSLFTHLPFNSIRRCLYNVGACMPAGGRFFASFFELPPAAALTLPFTHQPGGVVTYDDRDPYHYRREDFAYIVAGRPWRLDYIGDCGHPRAQKMLQFLRI